MPQEGDDEACSASSTEDVISQLTREIKRKNELLDEKERTIKHLQDQVYLERFGVYRFSRDDAVISFYTGFQSYKTFEAFFRWIQPTAQNAVSPYYVPSETISLAGRPRCMLLIDECFMFLCRLRVGLLEQDLSVRFNCSLPTVSRKFVTWLNLLYVVLGRMPIWLSRQVIDSKMPKGFRTMYPSTRVIIDCTEIYTERPSENVGVHDWRI